MIDQIIDNWLKSNKRIIVPGFGAFIRKDGDGEVVFVELLKKDDGVLASLLQRTYSLSEAQSYADIEQYVSRVKQALDKHGRYNVAGVGELHTDSEGMIQLSAPTKDSRAKLAPDNNSGQPAERVAPPASPQVTVEKNASPQQKITTEAPIHEYGNISGGTNIETRQSQIHDKRIDTKGMQYQKPAKTTIESGSKKRADIIMIVAIVAAVISILAMIYGVMNERGPASNFDLPQQTQEQVDSVNQ